MIIYDAFFCSLRQSFPLYPDHTPHQIERGLEAHGALNFGFRIILFPWTHGPVMVHRSGLYLNSKYHVDRHVDEKKPETRLHDLSATTKVSQEAILSQPSHNLFLHIYIYLSFEGQKV